MNLATAKSLRRAKEVGVRKVMGAFRSQIVFQYMTESSLIALIALLVAGVLVYFSASYLENQMGIALIEHLSWQTLLPLALIITLFTGLFAGSYPAFYLSSFKPAFILRDARGKGKSSSFIRKGLVVFPTYCIHHPDHRNLCRT